MDSPEYTEDFAKGRGGVVNEGIERELCKWASSWQFTKNGTSNVKRRRSKKVFTITVSGVYTRNYSVRMSHETQVVFRFGTMALQSMWR